MQEDRDSIDVSVVIPTYNRSALLVGCLERFAEQTLDRGRFEIVVVSDGSTDDTVSAARRVAERLSLAVRIVEGDHGGPGQARNLGVEQAIAPVIAFTDDDVRVATDWLERGLERFRASTVGGVEGRTESELGPDALFRSNVSNLAGGQYPTCNIFYRREVLREVGGFDVRLRRAREDSDLAFRVQDAGYEIPFAASVVARHRSHRSSVRTPLFIASTLPDSILLWSKHPGRDTLRPRFYRSDIAKLLLAVAAVGSALLGASLPAVVLGLGFLALTLRTMWAELVPSQALRLDRIVPLLVVYTALPFAHLFYFARGHLRVRAGRAGTEPAA